MTHAKTNTLTWIVAFATLVLFTSISVGAFAGETTKNQVSDWCDDGVKYEPIDTPFIVPQPPSGTTWSLLVIKSGHGAGENATWVNPTPTTGYSHPLGQANSHAILCWISDPVTTTTSSTTTSTPTSSTTTSSTTTSSTTSTSTTSTSPPTTVVTTTITEPTTTTSSTTTSTTTTTDPTTTTTVLSTTTSEVENTTTTSTVPQTTTTVMTELPNTGASDDLKPFALWGVFLLLTGGLSLLALWRSSQDRSGTSGSTNP